MKLVWSLGFDLFRLRMEARAMVRIGGRFKVRVRVSLVRIGGRFKVRVRVSLTQTLILTLTIGTRQTESQAVNS